MLAVIAIGVAIAVGGRAWDQFKRRRRLPRKPSAHFSDLGGAGRSDFWRVAIDSFGEKPLGGTGAGTYRFDWDKRRSIYLPLHDAHSLYLQTFAELGLVGGIVILALVGSVLWWAFCAWRDAREDQRELHAIVFAALVAMAVAFAIDWFWQILAMGAIFFIFAAVAISARCAQTGARRKGGTASGRAAAGASPPRPSRSPGSPPSRWSARSWSNAKSTRARTPRPANDLPSAVDHAEHARSIEPFAASPTSSSGCWPQLQGDYEAAISHFTNAIDREERQLAVVLPALQGRARSGQRRRGPGRPRKGTRTEPAGACLRSGECAVMARHVHDTAKRSSPPGDEGRAPRGRAAGRTGAPCRGRAGLAAAAPCCAGCSPSATGRR